LNPEKKKISKKYTYFDTPYSTLGIHRLTTRQPILLTQTRTVCYFE